MGIIAEMGELWGIIVVKNGKEECFNKEGDING